MKQPASILGCHRLKETNFRAAKKAQREIPALGAREEAHKANWRKSSSHSCCYYQGKGGTERVGWEDRAEASKNKGKGKTHSSVVILL